MTAGLETGATFRPLHNYAVTVLAGPECKQAVHSLWEDGPPGCVCGQCIALHEVPVFPPHATGRNRKAGARGKLAGLGDSLCLEGEVYFSPIDPAL